MISFIDRLIFKIIAKKSLRSLFFFGAIVIVAVISLSILFTKYIDVQTEAGTVRIIDLSMTAESAYSAKYYLSETRRDVEAYLSNSSIERRKSAKLNFDKFSKFLNEVVNISIDGVEVQAADLKINNQKLKELFSKIIENNIDLKSQKSNTMESDFHQLGDISEKLIDKYVDLMFDKKMEAIDALNVSRKKLRSLNLSVSLLTIFLSVTSIIFIYLRIRPLNKIILKLFQQAELVSVASNSILNSSKNFQQSSSSQSSAAAQSKNSVEEIAKLAEKTSASAKQLLENVHNSSSAVTYGHTKIEELLQIMKQIDQNSFEISNEVEGSNREIQEIITVISDIAETTKVINDIVFQTKLLSFNASVEAARAGDSGLGFAVVAQEIGSLAQMSGSSAQQISSTLNSGIEKVQKIISDSKRKLDVLTGQGLKNVKKGSEAALVCGDAFKTINSQISEVEKVSNEISNSIFVQTQDLAEIKNAMLIFDSLSIQNQNDSEVAFIDSNKLKAQSEELKNIVGLLQQITSGKNSVS